MSLLNKHQLKPGVLYCGKTNKADRYFFRFDKLPLHNRPDLHYWVKGNSELSNLHGTMDPDNNSSFIGFEEVTDQDIINRYRKLEKKAGIVPQHQDFESLINTYEI